MVHDPVSDGQPLFRPEAVEAARMRYGAPVRPVGVASWILVGFLLLILAAAGAFLATAKYARKESVVGVIEPSAGALRLVSPKPGVIESVEVAEGQLVKAETPLIRLRLDETTKNGTPLGALLNTATSEESHALEDQMLAHQWSTQRQQDELAAKRKGLVDHQARLVADLNLARERLALQQQSLESFKTLNEKKIVSDLQVRDRQDTVIQIRQAISAIEKDQEDSTSSIAQIDAQIARLAEDLRETVAQNHNSRAQLSEKQASNAIDSEIVLTAPKAGRVVAIQAKPGASVATAAALAIILPDKSDLDVQLWAPSKAAGFVRSGDTVRLLYDAFPYQRFGVGHGHVVGVANAPTAPNELPTPIDTKEPLYRIDVALERQTVDGYGKSWALAPGMRLTADLILDQRSFLEWLFDPLIAAKKRADG